ncbi:MAG: hypothetical protein J4A00_06340 [Gammaproteobacteria bacterium]|nr:hypothetical protein [Gammaproteobacteria bacterium]
MSQKTLLPETFEDLETLASRWSLPTQKQRWDKRLSSTMEEIQVFYDQMLPRMPDIIPHLNGFPLDDLPAPEARLLDLAAAYLEAALAVELFAAPDEPDVYPADRMTVRRATLSQSMQLEGVP